MAEASVMSGQPDLSRWSRPHEPDQQIDSPCGLVHATALLLTDSRNIPRSKAGGARGAMCGSTFLGGSSVERMQMFAKELVDLR
jgi:hypothetical protein